MPRRTRRRGGALNAQAITALYNAVESNNLSKVNELIAAGVDVNKTRTDNGITPLYIASRKGHLEIVERLITAGADVNKEDDNGLTPLYVASENCHLQVVERLIAAGADINKGDTDDETPLYIASLNGHLQIVERLIAAGADINKGTINDETPLFVASQNGHLEIAEQLIAAGADVNKTNNDDESPLFIASANGYLEIAEQLIAAGANVNKTNNDDETPLFAASINGYLEIVEQLIVANADVNKEDDNGLTPLYVASENCHLQVVERLIVANADVNKANNIGRTPLYIASILGYLKIMARLLSVTGIDVTIVKQNLAKFSPSVQTLIKKYLEKLEKSKPIRLWPGFSKSDSEKLGLLFEEKKHKNTLVHKPEGSDEVLYSHCPICLKYISHDEATCMYMSHNCTELGGFYYEELFNKYKHKLVNAAGMELNKEVVTWCTLCGRICKGHQHYKLESYTVDNPTLLKAGAPYETDCRKTNGGGGWPEKASRHRRLREYALELNEQVGKITTQDALEQLVEEMWNAPLRRETRVLGKMEAEKKYNTSHNEFPNIPYNRFPNAPNDEVFQQGELLSNNAFKIGQKTFKLRDDELYANNSTKAEAPYQYFYQQFKKGVQPIPNIPYPNNAILELKPLIHKVAPDGYKDPISPDYPDEENIVQFRHKQADGTVNNHENPETDMISKDSVFGMLSSALNNAELSKIGPCWKAGCTARIYPQELKAIIDSVDYEGAIGVAQKEADMKVYEQYRNAFNKKYK